MCLRFRDNGLSITAVLAGLLAIASTGLAIWAFRARNDANLTAEDLKKARAATVHEREAARLAAMNEQKAKANEEKARAQFRLADSRRIAALSASEQGKHLDRALILAVEAIRAENTFESRRSLLDALLIRPAVTSFHHRPKGYVTSVAFSPDGKMMAAACHDGPRGGGVLLWDVTRRAETLLAVPEGPVLSAAFSPDGKTLALGCVRGLVLCDLARQGRSGDKPLNFQKATGLSGVFGPLAFSPDSKTLAAAEWDRQRGGGVLLWDVARRTRLTEKPLLIAEEYPVTGLAFSPDGTTIATVCRVRLELWDMAHSQRLAEMPLAEMESVESVAFSPDGKTLAAGVELEIGAGVVLWDMTRRRRLAEEPLAVAADHVTSVAFSPDGKTVAAGCGDSVVLWELARRPTLADKTLAVVGADVTSVAFSPDGASLAAGYRRDVGG